MASFGEESHHQVNVVHVRVHAIQIERQPVIVDELRERTEPGETEVVAVVVVGTQLPLAALPQSFQFRVLQEERRVLQRDLSSALRRSRIEYAFETEILDEAPIVEAEFGVREFGALQAERRGNERMPPVEEVELRGDAIRAVPGLALGKSRLEENSEFCRGDVVDVILDDDLQELRDVYVARRLENAIAVPTRIVLLQEVAQAIVLPQ